VHITITLLRSPGTIDDCSFAGIFLRGYGLFLSATASYASYAAIALQLFGLMLILTKDLLKEKQSSTG